MGSAETRVTQVVAVETAGHVQGILLSRAEVSGWVTACLISEASVLAAMLSWPHTLPSAEPTNVAERAATRGHRAHGTARPRHLGLVFHAVPQ